MLEGYRKPKRHHKKRRHHRKHLGSHRRRKHSKRRRHLGGTSAHRKLFGQVAKICLVGKGPRAKKSKCMKIGLTKGLAAAKAFAK